MDTKDLGLIEYTAYLTLQNELLNNRRAGTVNDTLILAEHPSVITFGKLAQGEGFKDKEYFNRERVSFVNTTRGGKITYHGPGQLMIYPIIDLKALKKDITRYIKFLENAVIAGLKSFDIIGETLEGRHGVWVDKKKIAFIGVAVKEWVTYHGVSVNINNDITAFTKIIPCGENDITATSAKEIKGYALNFEAVKKIFQERFIEEFERTYVKHI
ncbi:lipoate-protein ligase B [Candidatus Omnitrophus magneticus]|uniref:Octanoyltransferase n=2 Tax=Candidatus Omnitrophus magneticus TaxID=1609969 RepID=A0A0F0CQU8_9BACT|nr:lipoate-protein ligase B [Candidatus Omnitrophus magneticus]